MSTYQVVLQYRQRLVCDVAGCSASVVSPVIDRTRPGEELQLSIFFQTVARLGWTLWSGRSLRAYCPDHGPRAGHSMRDVTCAWAETPYGYGCASQGIADLVEEEPR